MNQIFNTIIFIAALIVCQYLYCSALSRNDEVAHERSKRFAFLKTAGIGVSFPLSLEQIVFLPFFVICFLILRVKTDCFVVSVSCSIGSSHEFSESATSLHGIQFRSALWSRRQ